MSFLTRTTPKIFACKITEANPDAPFYFISINTLEQTPNPIYVGNGIYLLEFPLPLSNDINKIFPLISLGNSNGEVGCHVIDTRTIRIVTFDAGGTAADDILNSSSFRIQIFP